MGISLDYGSAKERLLAAIEWAKSARQVPAKWVERTAHIAALESITYTPMLGTALLARATDGRVDALSLKLASGETAYSARTLCHNVLVPASVTHKFSLRTTGREPLNNQPFFRYDRVDQAERVRNPESHAYLVSTLREVNSLSSEESLAALAAFLRQRLRVAQEALKVQLLTEGTGADQLIAAATELLADASEGGKRAQALVAAVANVAFDEVRTRRVNDPSRHFPGDVQAFVKNLPVLAIEVRDKPMAPTEVVQFGSALGRFAVARGLVAALSSGQRPLERDALRAQIWDEQGVLMLFAESIDELLLSALTWCTKPLARVLSDLPNMVAERLRELEVKPATLQLWRQLTEKNKG